jgi:DNA polymerase III alpha subunit
MIIVCGMISKLKRSVTKRNENMAYVTLEDLHSSIDVLVFPRLYAEMGGQLKEDQVVILRGRVNCNEEEKKLFADAFQFDITPDTRLEDSFMRGTSKTYRQAKPAMKKTNVPVENKKTEESNIPALLNIRVAASEPGELELCLNKTRELLDSAIEGSTDITLHLGEDIRVGLRQKKYIDREIYDKLCSVWGVNNVK